MDWDWKRIARIVIDEVAPVVIAAVFLVIGAVLLWRFTQPSQRQLDADYQEAVAEASRIDASFVLASLDKVDASLPITVVFWTSSTRATAIQQKFEKAHASVWPVDRDMWVVLSQPFQRFCSDYARRYQPNPAQLKLRLRQRLGLPPIAEKDIFVKFTIDPKDNHGILPLERACDDPSLDSRNTCSPLNRPKDEDLAWSLRSQPLSGAQAWILRKYYQSHSSDPPYPWTSLGYTFDWAREETTNDFVRYGPSEFIVPKDTLVRDVSESTTAAYCTP